MFRKDQLVWVKIDKFPLWPAKIKKVGSYNVDRDLEYEVKFLGESSTATIIEDNIKDFDPTRPEFTPSENVLKKNKRLQSALNQAGKIYYAGKKSKNQESIIQNKIQKRKGPISQKPAVISKSKKNKKNKQKDDQLVSVSQDERQVYPTKQEISDHQQISEEQKWIQLQHQQTSTDKIPKSVTKSSKEKRQSQNWGPTISSDILEDFSQSLSKKSSNPLKSEIQNVPLKSFQYMLPERPSSVNSFNKKQKISQKRQQKQQYKLQSFNKTLLNYISCLPETQNNPEQKLCKQIQFKLQCIVFLVYDSSSTNDPLKAKLKQLISIFDINKISAKVFMESKINALMSFILESLSEEFEEEKKWIDQTIDQINQKVIRSINDYEFYTNVQSITRNFISSNQTSSFLKSSQSSKSKLSAENNDDLIQFYKPKITKLLCSKIRLYEKQDIDSITDFLIRFLTESRSNAAQKWHKIELRFSSIIYQNRNQCYDDLLQLISAYS